MLYLALDYSSKEYILFRIRLVLVSDYLHFQCWITVS